MYKVFYDPNTLEIKGHSDGPVSMELPYIEIEYKIVLFENWKIEMIDGVPTLHPIKMQYTEEEWNKITNK